MNDKSKENISSHSLLEIPWEKNESSIQNNKSYLQNIKSKLISESPEQNLDLFFYSYEIILPDCFKSYTLPFTNTFHPHKLIKIKKENFFYEIKVILIEDIYEINCTNELIFLIGRKKLKSRCKSEESKKYKEAVLSQKEYTPEYTFYERVKERVYELQLKNQLNFSFIETSDDLIRELKSLIKSFDKEEYIPKVKKQSTPHSFLSNLLLLVPGISKNISKCICKNVNNLNEFIKKVDNSFLEGLEILSDDKINKRKLTKKQIDLIKSLLGK